MASINLVSAVYVVCFIFALLIPGAGFAKPTAEEIIKHCDYKNAGSDQRSLLSITLIDKDGSKRVNVYRRLWKNYFGEDGVADKMLLLTEFPPDAKGTGFMRWGYTAASGKIADQWLYLPQLRKIRRVSVRDPGDSFLGSDLTYGDIGDRAIDADKHEVVKVEIVEGQEYYVIESTPMEAKPQYSKKISWYRGVPDWKACTKSRVSYFDRMGSLLKTQTLWWQQVDGAWAWDRVEVKNVQTKHESVFKISDVEVDVGLKDRQFTERGLKKGEM